MSAPAQILPTPRATDCDTAALQGAQTQTLRYRTIGVDGAGTRDGGMSGYLGKLPRGMMLPDHSAGVGDATTNRNFRTGQIANNDETS